jgi:hypothetical protein
LALNGTQVWPDGHSPLLVHMTISVVGLQVAAQCVPWKPVA